MDIYHLDKLKPYLLQLSEMVSSRARNNSIAGKTIALFIRYHDMEKDGKRLTLPYYTSATHHIYEASLDLINNFNVNYGIRLIGISLSNLIYNSKMLTHIFDNPKLEDIYNTIDKINNRYGSFTICNASILMCKRIGSKTISPAWRPDGTRFVNVKM